MFTLPSGTSGTTDLPKEESSIFLRFRAGSESFNPDSSSTKIIKFFTEKKLFKIDLQPVKLTPDNPCLQILIYGSSLQVNLPWLIPLDHSYKIL